MEKQKVEQQSRNPNKLIIILLVLLIIIQSGLTVYAFYQISQLKSQIVELKKSPSPTPLTSPKSKLPVNNSPSPSPKLIENWYTYTNQNLAFSFLYPPNWAERNPVSEQDNTIVYFYSNKQIGENPEPLQYYVWITETQELPEYKTTEVLINHYPAYKTDQRPARAGSLAYFIKKSKDQYIVISLTPYRKENPYPEQSSYVEIFEKILSTFQFTDQPAKLMMKGTLKSMERPAADIAYDYKLELSDPYYDKLDASAPGYVNNFVIVPDNRDVKLQLEENIDNQITIKGQIEWGQAETRYLRALEIN